MADVPATQSARAQMMLRERILSGVLAPGERLYEVAAAEMLSISRTPAREAMSRLAGEGLLERVRGGGFMVPSFSPADAVDAIELRGVIEGTAARLAAERGASTGDLEAMHGLLKSLDSSVAGPPESIDIARYSELNTRFHKALWSLAGSALIAREGARVARLPFAAPSGFLTDTVREGALRRSFAAAQDQHRALISAIEAREGARAEAIAREHSRAARRNLEDMLAHGGAAVCDVPGLALIVAPIR